MINSKYPMKIVIVKFLIATILFLTSTVLLSQFTIAYESNTSEVYISCHNGDFKLINVDLSLYREENNLPFGPVNKYHIDEKGYVSLTLASGQYGVEAYSNGESGFHGYKKFVIEASYNQKSYKINIEMKKNSDHSSFIDLTPKYENAIINNREEAVNVISAVPGKEGNNEFPIFIQSFSNNILDEIKLKTSLNLHEVDSTTKEILTDIESKLEQNFQENKIQLESVGDTVPLGYPFYGIVTYETTYNVWHPLALIDSENGLTHQFSLSIYSGTKFTISSEIKYSGISASGSYSHEATVQVSFAPITRSNGAVATYRSEFRHVYQEGDIYYTYVTEYGVVLTFYWGPFQREYIDRWYTLSFEQVDSNQLTEVRDSYLGEWRSSCEADVVMTESTETTGSIGFEVKRGEIFGNVKISLTFKYQTKAHHHFIYNRPGTYWYVKFYRGRPFDINTYQYYGGGGGGCPILSVYNGEEYADEGLLNIHVEEGYPDVIFEHTLNNNPNAVSNKFLLRLIEHQKTHSFIDNVQLWAILKDGRTVLLPLISAIHSTHDNVKFNLKFSDEFKIDMLGADLTGGPSEYIDLQFVAISNLIVEEFVFLIEGSNYIIK